jgi:hypothetical protein
MQYCPHIPPQDCSACYQESFAGCGTSFTIHTRFTGSPAPTYYMWVQDKFENVYVNTVSPNLDGSVTVVFSNFPQSFFNIYAGYFQLWFTTDPSGYDLVPIPMGVSPDLTCIVFNIT